MAVTLQQIFQQHFDDFAKRRPLAPYQRAAGRKIRDCRTAKMGGHVLACPHGHFERLVFHSCRHRSCPQCAGASRESWLADWKQRLLNAPHVHSIFTTPHDLLPLWRYNKKPFAELLFQAARETLLELLADVKYLGGVPGLLLALHTWGQTLIEHVHLHVICTWGGLSPDGRWVEPVKGCLLPRRVLMTKFRGKFLALLLRALDKGELTLPPGVTERSLRNLLNKLGRVDWNVKLMETNATGAGVLTYLARYLRGGPLSNGRLRSCRDGVVSFVYRDHRDGESGAGRGRKLCRLPVDEFLSRLLEHVPPPGLQTVRSGGLYANSSRAKLGVARVHFKQPAAVPAAPKRLTWQERCERSGHASATVCPVCGAGLVSHSPFDSRGPPPWLVERLHSSSLAEVA